MKQYKEPMSGYCPYLGKNHTAYIKYEEILRSGGQPPGRKIVGYDCDSHAKCTKEYKKPCPLVNEKIRRD